MLRVGLAGLSQGYYAVTYMRYLTAQPDITCAGICDLGADNAYVRECAFTTAGAFANELNAPQFTSFSQLLDIKPDAVLICNETHQHVELAAQALSKGIHTFVSKPLSFNPSDFNVLKAVANKAILLCGNPLRYQPDIVKLEKDVRSGKVGKLYAIRASVCHQAMIHQEWERDAARSGGNLGTYAPYLFDLAKWITGERITTLYAQGDNFNTPQNSSADTIHIAGRLEKDGVCAIALYCGIQQSHPFFEAEVVGSSGWLKAVYEDNEASSSGSEDTTDLGTIAKGNPGAEEMDHFLDCVRSGATPICSIAEMEYTAACVEAVQNSMTTGQSQTVEVEKSD